MTLAFTGNHFNEINHTLGILHINARCNIYTLCNHYKILKSLLARVLPDIIMKILLIMSKKGKVVKT